MSKLMQDTYEIMEKLGSGGGGDVYLGRHTRLNKLVVLKEDKRSIQTSVEHLRREVDALKNLSYQYIPQVYDFFVEDERIYTVMDYIQGSSFDKNLEKGEVFSQKDVIKWGKQLLRALDYLHTQKPRGILHADIKPANIMLTEEGDIRLIDFNIALVLGADGAVAVGRSFGYASPEHYGYRFEASKKSRKQGKNTGNLAVTTSSTVLDGTEVLSQKGKTEVLHQDKTEVLQQEKTELLQQGQTELLQQGQTELSQGDSTELLSLFDENNSGVTDTGTAWEAPPSSTVPKMQENFQGYSYSTRSGSEILLDVRSDIYGLGATLYHLLSGERPHREAPLVKPLSRKKFHKSVIAIIEKAMNPDPDLRFQTAKEMLKALENLRKNDPNARLLRRVSLASALLCCAGYGFGGYYTFVGLTRMEATQGAKVLAQHSTNALAEGNPTLALDYALQSLPTPDGKLVPEYIPEGQFALSEALGVYQFSEGYHVERTVTLPSAVLGLSLSEDGELAVAMTLGELHLIEIATGEILQQFPLVHSSLSEFFFVDNTTLFFAGEEGVTLYDCAQQQVLWTGEVGTRLAKSNNGEYFASVYRDESRGFVYRRNGELVNEITFEPFHQRIPSNDVMLNPNDNLFAINDGGDLLALSFEGGGLMIYDCVFSTEEEREDLEFFDISDFSEFSGGFYGDYFAFSGTSGEGSLFAIFDCTNWSQTGGFQLGSKIDVTTLNSGIYLNTENIVVRIDPVSGEQTEIAYTGDAQVSSFDLAEDGHVLVLTDDSAYSFFDPLTNLIEKKQEGDSGRWCGAITNHSAIIGSVDSYLLKILTLQNYPEEQFASYDSYFEHLEARVTAQEEMLLYNLESLNIYGENAVLVGENTFLEGHDGIYDQQFLRDKDMLEVTYYDGTRAYYSAKTGELLEELVGEVPDSSLSEWFETDLYRIYSPLHGSPQVYEKNSENPEEVWKTIDVTEYLTYVTQLDTGILLEFISSDTSRYGLLCDENLEVLAKMPHLTDVKDGYFYFDEGKGNIKRQKIHTLEELLSLGYGAI